MQRIKTEGHTGEVTFKVNNNTEYISFSVHFVVSVVLSAEGPPDARHVPLSLDGHTLMFACYTVHRRLLFPPNCFLIPELTSLTPGPHQSLSP